MAMAVGAKKSYEPQAVAVVEPPMTTRPEFGPEILPPRVESEYRELFEREAEAAGIPVAVLEAVSWAESEHKSWARSKPRDDGSRDLGLFQFHSGFLEEFRGRYGHFDPMDAEEATRAAARHLAYLRKKLGAGPPAIAAYNAGEQAVLNNRIPESTRQYVRKIYGGE
jgi:soluble lytic murein transglycosylase-like protein